MDNVRKVVMIGTREIDVTDGHMPVGNGFNEEYTPFLIQSTADDIAMLLLLQGGGCLFEKGVPISTLIEERKNGLAALGANPRIEIANAKDRLKMKGPEVQADR